MSLRRKFVLYLTLVHLPFIVLAAYTFLHRRALLLLVEGLFVLSFALGLRLVRSLFGTLDLIRSGAQFIQEHDFGSRFREVGQPEMDQLVGIYNSMVDHLREERIRLEEQHYFLGKVLKASPSGIVTLDFDGGIAMVNPAAEKILRAPTVELAGRTLEEIEDPFARALADLRPGESKVVPLHGRRRLKCHRSEFLDRGFARSFYLMEELTEELRQSEKTAYEKLIRMMSHEVNNSVGAASSLLESCMSYKDQIRYEDREDYVKALGVVIARTSQLNAFMRTFSDVVRIPPPNREPVDLCEVLEGITALFRAEAESRGISWVWEMEADAPGSVTIDRGQMEQVFVNIIKNAIEAIGRDGVVTIRLGRISGRPCVVVEDTGGGITPEVRANLFVPFFSTKENGQGIGLTTVQEILTQHGFDFSLDGGGGQPTRFTVLF